MYSTRSLAQMALLVSLLIVFGFLPKIPLGFIPVPLVLQNLGVLLTALLLPAKHGILVLLVFLLIGLVFPVFSGGATSLSVLSGPTAGYVIAWLVVPVLYQSLSRLVPSSHYLVRFLLLVLSGVLPVMLIGSIWLSYYTGSPFYETLLANLIFLPGDSLKAGLAVLVSQFLKR